MQYTVAMIMLHATKVIKTRINLKMKVANIGNLVRIVLHKFLRQRADIFSSQHRNGTRKLHWCNIVCLHHLLESRSK